MNQSAEAPRELMIRDLPLSESLRDFQWLRRFSNLITRLS